MCFIDIPGAFMQEEMNDTVHVKMEGCLAELLVKIDPELYRKFLSNKNGKSVLYVRLKKAVYGTLQAAMLFWRTLTAKLVEMGFEINPHDRCVANKLIDGKQCTILWHVDDITVSHCNAQVVTEVVNELQEEYRKEAPLTVSHGKKHDYLGMVIDYSRNGAVTITMFDFISNMLKELPSDMDGVSATPDPLHLFAVDENAKGLDEPTAQFFHHNVANLLFLCKRACRDIQTAVAFLCTIEKCPDVDDYKKLTRVMKYLWNMENLPLVLEAENLNTAEWWVNASFALHPNMHSHTGCLMMLGSGAVYASSTKQKLNTNSSTEAELVGVYDAIHRFYGHKNFLLHRGLIIVVPSYIKIIKVLCF